MRTLLGLVVVLGSVALGAAAYAGDVCTYTVQQASFGFFCPVQNVNTACLSLSAVTGPCNVPLQCYGGRGFFCRFLLLPKSGPQPLCPFNGKRLDRAGQLRCTRLRSATPTATVTRTKRTTPTDTPTPTVTGTTRETPTHTPTPTATTPFGCPDPNATPTPGPSPPAPGNDSLTPGPCTDAETGVAGLSAGSIVVLPKLEADSNRDTVIQLTNRTNREAFARCFYVDGSLTDPTQPPGPMNPPLLLISDFILSLTAQQPIQWTVSTGRVANPTAPADPGAIPPVVTPFVGELKCVEVDASMQPIGGNSLTAEATLLGPAGDVSKYDAITLQATNVNSDNVLNLDDVEYSACPRELIFNVIADEAQDPALGAGSSVSNHLTLVSCREDFEAQQFAPVTVFALTSDEFELLLSATFIVDGFLDIDLPDLSSVFVSFGETFRQLRLSTAMIKRCAGGNGNGALCDTDTDCVAPGVCLPQSPVLGTLEATHTDALGGSGRAMQNAHTCGSNPGAVITLSLIP